MQDNKFKVAMVGCGRVGMAAVFAMLMKGVVTEMILWGREIEKVEGEKMDLDEAQPLMSKARIVATNKWEDLAASDVVVVAAGAAQQPGQSRLDLARENTRIIEEIMPKILAVVGEAVILIVTNPVDVLVYKANEIEGVKQGRVFGSGTMLDTMRFRHYLAGELEVDPHNVHAYVLGEHGDHSFPVYENAAIGGQKLLAYPGVEKVLVEETYEKAKDAAGKIIEAKGATWWAIGMVISRIVEAIANDEKVILPLSVPLDGYRGQEGVALSVPCKLGRGGVEEILEVDLSAKEEEGLREAASVVRKVIEEIK